MSPRKLTEDDKQEILQLYRNSEATTSTLANRFEVSSSTISRFLKNKLSSTEYEDLIQQKRLARTPRGEKAVAKQEPKETTSKAKKTRKKSVAKTKSKTTETPESLLKLTDIEATKPTLAESSSSSEPKSKTSTKRRRRRSSAPLESETTIAQQPETEVEAVEIKEEVETKDEITSTSQPQEITSKSDRLILKSDKTEVANTLLEEIEEDDDDDDDELDLITLKEMLGEDLEDINDEDEDEDDDDWEDDGADLTYSKKDSDFSQLEILPLSQATFPRICYLVIDRSAELIVKPLAEFADLGDIPQDEIKQRTLPVFDNHRIAKRFSHRRERVIKVPDGNMLQKTSRHLQEKGITRLLMDGQIYSLHS